MSGGYSSYSELTPEDLAVFESVTDDGYIGRVLYTPQLVSKQIVAGVNYRFKCEASQPPAEVLWEAVVDVFQPLEGKPARVTGITTV